MPRCYTINKVNAQHNLLIQQHNKKGICSSEEKNSEICEGRKQHRKVAVIQVYYILLCTHVTCTSKAHYIYIYI